jgi:hypothetical protein
MEDTYLGRSQEAGCHHRYLRYCLSGRPYFCQSNSGSTKGHPAVSYIGSVSSYTQLPWNMLHDAIPAPRGASPSSPTPVRAVVLPPGFVLEAQRARAHRGSACLPQRARDVEEAPHPLPLSRHGRRHPFGAAEWIKEE